MMLVINWRLRFLLYSLIHLLWQLNHFLLLNVCRIVSPSSKHLPMYLLVNGLLHRKWRLLLPCLLSQSHRTTCLLIFTVDLSFILSAHSGLWSGAIAVTVYSNRWKPVIVTFSVFRRLRKRSMNFSGSQEWKRSITQACTSLWFTSFSSFTVKTRVLFGSDERVDGCATFYKQDLYG